jgi:signal transduction histidine kinase
LRCRLHISPIAAQHRNVQPHPAQYQHGGAREAMHNVIKHAKASQVTVHISFAEMLLTVSIQDDGCGFDLSTNPTGHGLVNMKRRLEDIGGSCLIESSPEKLRIIE